MKILNQRSNIIQCANDIVATAMVSAGARDAAKQVVKALEMLPEERIKHLISLKEVQLTRFRAIAGLSPKSKESIKSSLEEIKDIINRTSGPLGLQKKSLHEPKWSSQDATLTEDYIKSQLKSLQLIMNNKYKLHYDVGDKLYKPAGNPGYYKRLLDEIEGKGNETFFSAVRTVLFGK